MSGVDFLPADIFEACLLMGINNAMSKDKCSVSVELLWHNHTLPCFEIVAPFAIGTEKACCPCQVRKRRNDRLAELLSLFQMLILTATGVEARTLGHETQQ